MLKSPLAPAVCGLAVAIAITTAMDATGLAMFSALPLFPLAGLFWYLQKFSRADMGLSWGSPRFHWMALSYVAAVLGSLAVVAWLAGAVDTSDANWNNAAINLAAGCSIGVLMVLITEEGFFRGWLWAAMQRAGLSTGQTVLWTTLAFTLWHVSAISLDTGFDIPAAEIPIFLVNATLLGGAFAVLRAVSGSVLVASVFHAVWNAFAYSMYGFGEKTGELGIQQTHIYGPEVGVLAIALHAIAIVIVMHWTGFELRTLFSPSRTTTEMH